MRFSTSVARILRGSNSSISRTLSAAKNEFASYLPALRAASLLLASSMMPSRTTLSPTSQRAHHLQGIAKSIKASITKIPNNMDAQRSTKSHHEFHRADNINTMSALSNQVVAFQISKGNSVYGVCTYDNVASRPRLDQKIRRDGEYSCRLEFVDKNTTKMSSPSSSFNEEHRVWYALRPSF